MLTEEQKKQIVNEEIAFRDTVRLHLHATGTPETKRTKIWSFLNSSFTLWLLGSVVFGFVTDRYQRFQKEQEFHRLKVEQEREELRKAETIRLDEERRKTESLRKLNDQLTFTLTRFDSAVQLSENREDLIYALDDLFTPTPLFPEFAGRTFESFLLEAAKLKGEGAGSAMNAFKVSTKLLRGRSRELRRSDAPDIFKTAKKELIDNYCKNWFDQNGWIIRFQTFDGDFE